MPFMLYRTMKERKYIAKSGDDNLKMSSFYIRNCIDRIENIEEELGVTDEYGTFSEMKFFLQKENDSIEKELEIRNKREQAEILRNKQ